MDEIQPDASRPWLAVGVEVKRVLEQIDPDQFDATLTSLRDAHRTWFFCGQGRSGLVAEMAAMRFMHLGRRVHVQGEATTPAIRDGDGLLVISGTATTPVSLHYGTVAKEQGAGLVVVTYQPAGPLAKMADALLVLPAGDSCQFGGSLFEQCALLVLDAIALALARVSRVTSQDMAHRHTNLE